MKTFNHRELSDLHIDTLAQSVTNLQIPWTLHHLDIHTVCVELGTWDFEKPQQSGYSLLLKDLNDAAAILNQNARRHLGQALTDLLGAAGFVPPDVQTVKGSVWIGVG